MTGASHKAFLSLTPFELHKQLINTYVLQQKGSTSLLQRDTSRDKRDIDVIRENHCFLWDENKVLDTWEEQLAKKYHDKLFKEYAICDLSRYKENKVAMRWQTEEELVSGKGQFKCGEKRCSEAEHLRTWEVNFGYTEHGAKKNALVKLRLCLDCTDKLNYYHKKKEVKKSKIKKRSRSQGSCELKKQKSESSAVENGVGISEDNKNSEEAIEEQHLWRNVNPVPEERSREEDFEEYFDHLLF